MPVYPIGYYDNYFDNHFDRFVFANPSRNRDFPRCGKLLLLGRAARVSALPFYGNFNAYSLSISRRFPASPLFRACRTMGTIIGGQYTLTGSGGKDVGPFTGLVNLGSPLTITGGLPSTVNRSAGLTLSWTGGNSSDLVIIEGLAVTTSSTTTASGITFFTENGGEFVCTTTAGGGGFTVPASVTSQFAGVESRLLARRHCTPRTSPSSPQQPVERQRDLYRTANCRRKCHGVLPRLRGSNQRAGLAVGGFRIQAARITIGSMTPSASWLLTFRCAALSRGGDRSAMYRSFATRSERETRRCGRWPLRP